MKRFVVVLALLALFVSTPTALAAEQTVTVALRVSAPLLGKSALGTMVLRNSGVPESFAVDWTFTGQVDGLPASASGRGEARFADGTYEVTITEVQNWDMGGIPRPKLPLRMAARAGANQTFEMTVFARVLGTVSTPLSLQGAPELPAPFTGDLILSVTNAPAVPPRALPNTGLGDDRLSPLLALAAAAGAVALVAGGRRVVARRRQAVR